ncbi:MAG: hypothetical protein V3V99_05460 [candidate division Zixibacteria bacterium]
MGLFDRKPKLDTQDFCDDFYDNYVFAPDISGVNPWHTFCDIFQQQLLKLDPNFAVADVSRFPDQLLALRLEVIGIVWMLHVKQNLSPIQSQCTRTYLTYIGRSDLWDMMKPYNKATADSTFLGSDGNTPTGRAHITFINSMRAQVFDKWAIISNAKDAGRAANRIGCKVPWKSRLTHTCLSFVLTEQLQCEINEEARLAIIATIQGFYEGTYEKLSEVKIVS